MAKREISSKIIKMDEINQHGMSMTRPLLYGCIKKRYQPPTFVEFDKIVNEIYESL